MRESAYERESGRESGWNIHVSVHIKDTYLPIATPGDHSSLWTAAWFTCP